MTTGRLVALIVQILMPIAAIVWAIKLARSRARRGVVAQPRVSRSQLMVHIAFLILIAAVIVWLLAVRRR